MSIGPVDLLMVAKFCLALVMVAFTLAVCLLILRIGYDIARGKGKGKDATRKD